MMYQVDREFSLWLPPCNEPALQESAEFLQKWVISTVICCAITMHIRSIFSFASFKKISSFIVVLHIILHLTYSTVLTCVFFCFRVGLKPLHREQNLFHVGWLQFALIQEMVFNMTYKMANVCQYHSDGGQPIAVFWQGGREPAKIKTKKKQNADEVRRIQVEFTWFAFFTAVLDSLDAEEGNKEKFLNVWACAKGTDIFPDTYM